MSLTRGAVWFADVPDVGDKPVLIVSPDFINRALSNLIAARITSVARPRSLPTIVQVEAGGVTGLTAESFVVCHDLFTLPQAVFRRYLGHLPPHHMLRVEDALKVALGLA